MRSLKSSFVELDARSRARAVLDRGTFREIVGPFDQLESPHLLRQGIVPQSDDGVVVARGTIAGESAVAISIEGKFQGGGIGEISGSKIAGALELALQDNEKGVRTRPVLLLDTGGVRLQEANYGLLSIAEIGAAVVALRQFVPVVGVIPGKIGCFGGMSIVAGLCSFLLMTREGRLGLNGPEVIEQEAGMEEFDSSDRPLIWNTIGGAKRFSGGLADRVVDDDVPVITEAIRAVFAQGVVKLHRSSQVERFLPLLQQEGMSLQNEHEDQDSRDPDDLQDPKEHLSSQDPHDWTNDQGTKESRGKNWFAALGGTAHSATAEVPSVLCADTNIGTERVRLLAVVPNPHSRFPRARQGEVGLEEGWMIAKYVREAMEADKEGERRAIVAIVDVPSQAYGYREELLGIHQALAAAVDAYAEARLAGHPVIALLVGKAISGAFLAHGFQANRILALDDKEVSVHAMSKQSAARITRRTMEELEEATKKVPAMAYDIQSFATLGALHDLIDGVSADRPDRKDRERVAGKIREAIESARSASRHLDNRLKSAEAQEGRAASLLVRKKLAEQWM